MSYPNQTNYIRKELANQMVAGPQIGDSLNSAAAPLVPKAAEVLYQELVFVNELLQQLTMRQYQMRDKLFGPMPENPECGVDKPPMGAIGEIATKLQNTRTLVQKALDYQAFFDERLV